MNKKKVHTQKAKKKKSIKDRARKIHLWTGLSTGLIVFIMAITGCCWVFKDEIKSFSDHYTTVKVQDKPFITATQAKVAAQKALPGKKIHGAVYGNKDQAIEVTFYEAKPKFYQSVFLNPYTGKVLHVEDHLSGFFAFVLRGHMYLWLPEAIGSRLTAYATLLFLAMVITGLILWYPRNKKNRKQRFRFIWKPTTGWKRKNFDLHTVVGFYISIFAFVFAFTGCVMAFNWFYFIAFKATGGTKDPRFVIPNSQITKKAAPKAQPIDELLPRLQAAYPKAERFELHYPTADTASIYVEIFKTTGVYYNIDYRFYDQYTLKELSTPSLYGAYKDAVFADKVIRMNYDIHVGSIGGLPGKIIAFLASLVTASLPVTGFLMWWGRRKKKALTKDTQEKPDAVAV
ncbi:PepSY domain-containing protein [uncultured Microscilla sp.]|uniref:PepSY-associated TM helix domain-containing protein n=1 Tax=uncultured Microscilla sp. TaxID=432653 RepID=UPI00260DE81B|nr:PepSY-associated TM helix domain-containing protein [uncultured Microscilla sp.]